MAKVEFKNVTKVYKMGSQDIYANNDVNFVINDKEFCVIVGPSGAGKTTQLHVKEWIRVLPYTVHKNKLKNGLET